MILLRTRPKVSIIDNFNRGNASNLGGAPWTQGGSGPGIGITSNATSWANGSLSDGTAWALHDTPLNNDAFYTKVSATNANSARDSRISAGTLPGYASGALLNWYSNAIYFARYTGSYGSTSDLVPVSSGISIGATDIEFYRLYDNGHWRYFVNIAGVNKVNYLDSSDLITVGPANRRVGFGQERSLSFNSGFITQFEARDI